MSSEPIRVRRATPEELPRVREFYAASHYGGEVRPDDAVFIAEKSGSLFGIVRLAHEHGTIVLRGMRVAAGVQRQRIGTRLLHALVAPLEHRECYCIPYAHLTGFYAQASFKVLAADVAPAFLAERLASYRLRGDGKSYLIMYRPPSGTGAP